MIRRETAKGAGMSVAQLFDLKGKVALVTGGSRGLGLQMCDALGEMGARIAITARKQNELDEASAHLAAQRIEALAIAGDLSRTESIAPLVDQVLKRYGTIDILVNNAGATWGASAEEYPPEAWHKVINLNLNSVFFLTQEVGRRAMIPRKGGNIVNIASVAGFGGNMSGVGTIAYNTSKAGLINFTRALACEWGKHRIRVNAIAPGFFPSKMSRGLLEQVKDSVIARTPLSRIGNDEDLKGAIVYLASEASRHVTGHCIVVDGGRTLVSG
jgi:NAD(P)-dependent dehydrogenase (short-subunit alcohol dehydrogenase family)